MTHQIFSHPSRRNSNHGNFTVVATTGVSLSTNTWYSTTFAAVGNSLKTYIGGAELQKKLERYLNNLAERGETAPVQQDCSASPQ